MGFYDNFPAIVNSTFNQLGQSAFIRKTGQIALQNQAITVFFVPKEQSLDDYSSRSEYLIVIKDIDASISYSDIITIDNVEYLVKSIEKQQHGMTSVRAVKNQEPNWRQ